jgi:hypothetical protein
MVHRGAPHEKVRGISQSWLQPAFSRLLEFLHFSSSSSVNQGLIGDLEAERSE